MKLIVGLGNPGASYRQSRHNVGFLVVAQLQQRWSIEVKRHKFKGLFGDGRVGGQQVALLAPQTYMNRSGASVSEAVNFFQLSLADILVVMDDMDLELGQLRLRSSGSPGGHKGLRDIIAHLGTDEFARMRIGIGAAPAGDSVDYVLGNFSVQEQPLMEAAFAQACQAVECWVHEGIDQAMNRFNRRKDENNNSSTKTDEQN